MMRVNFSPRAGGMTKSENAALNAIRAYLDQGSAISVRHLAATPTGHSVTATAEVIRVAGRRIEFAVSAHDEAEAIGEGTHEGAVIDVRRLMQRLEGKGRLRCGEAEEAIVANFRDSAPRCCPRREFGRTFDRLRAELACKRADYAADRANDQIATNS